jgi:hypothetical protein
MGFRDNIRKLAEGSGLFEVDASQPPAKDAVPEDPLAAMEALVAESRKRVVARPNPAGFSAPPAPASAAAREDESLEVAGPPEMLSIDQVYSRASLPASPDSGTVLKVILLTSDPNLSALPRETKAGIIRASLAADRVTPDAVVDDAVARDRALDAAAEYLTSAVNEFRDRATGRVSELEAERDRMLADLNRRITALRQAIESAEVDLAAWRRQKRDVERGLFEAIAMVVPAAASNPITLDSEAPGPNPPRGGGL